MKLRVTKLSSLVIYENVLERLFQTGNIKLELILEIREALLFKLRTQVWESIRYKVYFHEA